MKLNPEKTELHWDIAPCAFLLEKKKDTDEEVVINTYPRFGEILMILLVLNIKKIQIGFNYQII